MRSVLYKLIIAASLVACLFSIAGCLKDSCNSSLTFQKYIPVYMKLSELRASVKREAPRAIEQPGKIYLYGKYIFLNELNKGIHVIDNSNPSAPNKIAFINIPGNVDIAVKNNILYADSYIDLLALDISDPQNVRETKRIEFAFPYRQYDFGIMGVDTVGGRVVVDFMVKDTTVQYKCQTGNNLFPIAYDAATNTALVQSTAGTKSSTAMALGKSGSLARFTILSSYLYTIDRTRLSAYEITTPSQPAKRNTIWINADIETIFPYKNHLFIGSMTGMFIYDASNPAYPVNKGAFNHLRRCDPVVVQDDIAYVTLRGAGTTCGGSTNELHVLDVADLSAPRLLKSYPMSSPYGLGIDGSKLFVCEGEFGLKFLNVENTTNISTAKWLEGINAYDVIPHNNVLLVTAKDGLYQYDYTDQQAPKLLSKLSITVKQ